MFAGKDGMNDRLFVYSEISSNKYISYLRMFKFYIFLPKCDLFPPITSIENGKK